MQPHWIAPSDNISHLKDGFNNQIQSVLQTKARLPSKKSLVIDNGGNRILQLQISNSLDYVYNCKIKFDERKEPFTIICTLKAKA